MSRIEEILAKAARDGEVRRTSDIEAGPVETAPPPDRRARLSAVDPAVPARPATPPPRGLAAAPLAAAPSAVPVAPPRSQPPASVSQPGAAAAKRGVANPVLTPVHTVRSVRPDPLLVAAVSPHSTAAEQYRAIRTRIAQSESGRHCRTILVTSPLNGDGKTLTAVNLALTMAQEFHRRVVAVDADLRKGSLHRLFGLADGPGLSDVLLGVVPLEEALVSLPDFRLTVLPAGNPAGQPAELLGSAEMRRVVDTLHTQFDRIVADTPPASPLADVGVLTPLVDGIVLVVRAGRTPRPSIDRALEEFEPERLLGIVLNDVEKPALEIRP